MLHGCILTDWSTSLCKRIFSNICSLVDSWLLAPSPSDTTVLQSIHRKQLYGLAMCMSLLHSVNGRLEMSAFHKWRTFINIIGWAWAQDIFVRNYTLSTSKPCRYMTREMWLVLGRLANVTLPSVYLTCFEIEWGSYVLIRIKEVILTRQSWLCKHWNDVDRLCLQQSNYRQWIRHLSEPLGLMHVSDCSNPFCDHGH